MKKSCFVAFVLLGAAAYGLNWDNALIMGTTPGGKMFYAPGEERVFTLKLEGMKEPLPADTYFVDWERRGDGGIDDRSMPKRRDRAKFGLTARADANVRALCGAGRRRSNLPVAIFVIVWLGRFNRRDQLKAAGCEHGQAQQQKEGQ